ncbi:hypothetical protein [Ancylobacter sp. G4_0304]|uniref:hypothetical protein n=1 Tax=Ancylobacter sp. G4_0304 TaxID=3114289 RepID=UPI0039C65F2E
MEKIGTPLDELEADNARTLAEHRELNDEVGCFYRFMEQFDANKLAAFIQAEARRGVTIKQLVDAVAQGIAYQFVAVALMSTDEHRAYRDLVIAAQKYAIAMMDGRHSIGVVHIGKDGVQHERTVEGVFRRRGGRS